MNPVRVLALDISRKRLGWTADSAGVGGPPQCSSLELAHAGADPGHIGMDFKNFLVDALVLTKPKILAIEAPVLAGVPQDQHDLEIKLGLLMLARVIVRPHGIRVVLGAVGKPRKYLLGSERPGATGRESKRLVFEFIRDVLGWPVDNEDESDSAALWAWCKANEDPKFRMETGQLLSRIKATGMVA